MHSAMYVAIIAVFHVVASHLTVGAAWFNLYIERKAVKEDRPELYDYLRRSAKGLLVFAYVFGAMSGVGIWQATTAANPRGISALIHNFVLFWGSEWYMFIIDVVGIIVYYYTLEKVDARTHLRLAWILALGGTGTLSLIVGILGFKATPGAWLETGEPLDGFFNPTFWPQYPMRLFVMLAITSVWAIVIAAGMRKGYPERERIIRAASFCGLGGLAGAVLLGRFWYIPQLSDRTEAVLTSQALPAVTVMVIVGGMIVVAIYLMVAAWSPAAQTRLGSIALFVVVFAAVFGAERTREVARKPDIVSGYMSSNQLVFDGLEARGIPSEEAAINEAGVAWLPWANIPPGDLDPDEAQYQRGRMIALQQCASCHSVSDQTVIEVSGTQLALRQQSRLFDAIAIRDEEAIDLFLTTLGGYPFMHEFVGTDEDRRALAAYIATTIAEQQGVETNDLATG
ncbi:MAG: c-type cytochrome [Acidimicrobiales bacterium]